MCINNLLKCFLMLSFVFAVFQQLAHAEDKGKYRTFYVFGDSLSDTGNDLIYTASLFKQLGLPSDYPAIPPSVRPHKTYYRGRFSNGPVAVEYLWQSLRSNPAASLKPSEGGTNLSGERAVNFAYGGSGSGASNKTPGGYYVPGALGQVNSFLQTFGNTVPKAALYAIWTGANDYLLGLHTDPAPVIANISQAIQALYAAGARNFLVPNLPDVGSVPILADPNIHAYPPGSSQQLTALTLAHNAALASALQGLRQQHSDINLIGVDVFTYFNQLRASLKPGAGPGGDCLFTDPSLGGGPYTCADVKSFAAPGYLFWDVEHPTTKVHKLISRQMLKALRRNRSLHLSEPLH